MTFPGPPERLHVVFNHVSVGSGNAHWSILIRKNRCVCELEAPAGDSGWEIRVLLGWNTPNSLIMFFWKGHYQ